MDPNIGRIAPHTMMTFDGRSPLEEAEQPGEQALDDVQSRAHEEGEDRDAALQDRETFLKVVHPKVAERNTAAEQLARKQRAHCEEQFGVSKRQASPQAEQACTEAELSCQSMEAQEMPTKSSLCSATECSSKGEDPASLAQTAALHRFFPWNKFCDDLTLTPDLIEMGARPCPYDPTRTISETHIVVPRSTFTLDDLYRLKRKFNESRNNNLA